MVHDVGFEEDHRAFVDSGGEEVAEPKVRFAEGLAGGFAAVVEGWQAGGGGHASSHGGAEGNLRIRDALHNAEE